MAAFASVGPVSDSDLTSLTIAVLGGTGPQGRGLARRFAAAGLDVVLGSRSAERAAETAATLAPQGRVRGMSNSEAAAAADVVLVVVPWDGHAELLRSLTTELAGKIVVDCVNPLGFDKQGPFALAVEEGSATQQAAAILTESRVVGAFHNVSATLLEDPEVEQVLDSHPAVVESAVVAMPDEKWGEVPVAYVTVRSGHELDEDELTAYLRERLAHFKVPHRYVVGELPRTSTGKIRKNVLRERARSE